MYQIICLTTGLSTGNEEFLFRFAEDVQRLGGESSLFYFAVEGSLVEKFSDALRSSKWNLQAVNTEEALQQLEFYSTNSPRLLVIADKRTVGGLMKNDFQLRSLLRLIVSRGGVVAIEFEDSRRLFEIYADSPKASAVKSSLLAKFINFAAECDKHFADTTLRKIGSKTMCAEVDTAATDKKVSPAMNEKGNEVVLVIGSGGREHALAHALSKSPSVQMVYVSPGNFGTGYDLQKTRNVPELTSATEISQFVSENAVSLVVIGPEQPLVDGIADALSTKGIACFGPSKDAAEIEASKAWSKDFMDRNDIPTAKYATFTAFADAEAYLKSTSGRVVVKASGLAAGKGVLIPQSISEAIRGARAMLDENLFGEAGGHIVIEEFLEGEEVSILAFCDGEIAVGMPPAQDHKRALNGDEGLNTGGMGAYAPTPLITPAQYEQCMEIMQKSVTAMKAEGRPFMGVLYGGFILTPNNGPMVLEFNCRFGDPETQVLLPLLESDLFTVMRKCVSGTLNAVDVKWSEGQVACTVVCAAPGYPLKYPKGLPVFGLESASDLPGVTVYHAGTKSAPAPPPADSDAGELIGYRSIGSTPSCVTNGGRVLAVTGSGKSLQNAVDTAYIGVSNIHFERMHFRTDIAKKGLKRRVRLGVLGSTRGTDMQAIIDAIESGKLPAEIVVVISNRKTAMILERAANHNLKHIHVSAVGKEREIFDAEVSEALKKEGVDLVLLIGYMRIVSPLFVALWRNRCLNVHPSLLPDFAGGMDSDVHSAVIAAGRKESGCTIHIVTEEVDGGAIVIQKVCDVSPTETAETLKAKVQKLEGEAFLEAIKLFHEGGLAFGSAITTGEFFRSQHTQAVEQLSYRTAGVDIDAGDDLVQKIKPLCKGTVRAGCEAELGGFGGLFDLAGSGYPAEDTVLVAGSDGVGTKIVIAQTTGNHHTIGIDLVAMCANDILVCGAEPLFFLDYYATGKLNVDDAVQVVEGIAEGCKLAGAALAGGETAEMAGMYGNGEYDLAGFCVGAVRRNNILPNPTQPVISGDVLIGIRSSGIHSNGFSLVRKCISKVGLSYFDPAPFQKNITLGEALLTPTRIYVKQVLPLIHRHFIKALAHITGGGLPENLPRVLPPGVVAEININEARWRLPPVFRWLQTVAKLPQKELLRTFNCGVGMVLIVDRTAAPIVMQELFSIDDQPLMLGTIRTRTVDDESTVNIIGELF